MIRGILILRPKLTCLSFKERPSASSSIVYYGCGLRNSLVSWLSWCRLGHPIRWVNNWTQIWGWPSCVPTGPTPTAGLDAKVAQVLDCSTTTSVFHDLPPHIQRGNSDPTANAERSHLCWRSLECVGSVFRFPSLASSVTTRLPGPCLSSTSQNIRDPPKSYRFWGNIGMIHSKMDFRSTQFRCRSTPESNKNDSRMTGFNGLSVQKDAEKHGAPWKSHGRMTRNPTLAAYAGGIHGVDRLVQGSVLQHQVPALTGAAKRLHQRTNCPHMESANRLETRYKHANYWMIGSPLW